MTAPAVAAAITIQVRRVWCWGSDWVCAGTFLGLVGTGCASCKEFVGCADGGGVVVVAWVRLVAASGD